MDIIALRLPYFSPISLSPNELMHQIIFLFYYAIGPSNFDRHFSYEYKNSCLRLISDIKTYDEWIYSLNGRGEGCLDKDASWSLGDIFRKTSLIACRDYHLSFRLSSREWTLTITSAVKASGNCVKNYIIYDGGECDYHSDTVFEISGVDRSLYRLFLKEVKNFRPINYLKSDEVLDDSPKFERITEVP